MFRILTRSVLRSNLSSMDKISPKRQKDERREGKKEEEREGGRERLRDRGRKRMREYREAEGTERKVRKNQQGQGNSILGRNCPWEEEEVV